MEMESTDSTIFADYFTRLPEEVISHVISLTTPRDACVASAVCHAFQSAADSNATWRHFLPSDYALLLSRAAHPVEYASNKELYFHLCDHPLLIDGGLMSFGLERPTGAKIFMISARRLSIAWGDNPNNWDWIALPDSRFSECAELNWVFWLDICGRINSELLTPSTSTGAYLVFKLRTNVRCLRIPFQTTEVTLSGDMVSQHSVCINPDSVTGQIPDNVIRPSVREDGWLEVELGTFDTGDGIDEEVAMSFRERSNYHSKHGLIVQGIEVRPIIIGEN